MLLVPELEHDTGVATGPHEQITERSQQAVEVAPGACRRRRLEQQTRRLQQPVALRIGAFGLADVGEEDDDAVVARVVPLLEPGIEGWVVGLERAKLAELHGPALVGLEVAAHGL